MNDYQKNILSRYKPLIKPKDAVDIDLIKYLGQKYTCADVTGRFKGSASLEIACLNCQNYKKLRNMTGYNNIDMHVIRIPKDSKSESLFWDNFDGPEILVYIDAVTQYFQTDNSELFYLLAVEKSVSFESFNNDDIDLLDLASLMYVHDGDIKNTQDPAFEKNL